MSLDIKYTIKELNNTIKNLDKEENAITKLCDNICKNLNSDIIILDNKGNILLENISILQSFSIENPISNEKAIELQIVKQLENLKDTKINITLDNLYTTKFNRQDLKNIYGIFIPLYIYKEKIAYIIIYRKDCSFEENINILCDYISSIFSILIWNNKNKDENEKIKKRQNLKTCMSTLSFSELEAIINIFDEIKDGEGLVIASKIADKAGITRSVIVNALRKFESAQIIETRSLGMKGTYIKVLNEYLPKELDKLKK